MSVCNPFFPLVPFSFILRFSPTAFRKRLSNWKSFCDSRRVVEWLLVLSIDPNVLKLDPTQLTARFGHSFIKSSFFLS